MRQKSLEARLKYVFIINWREKKVSDKHYDNKTIMVSLALLFA